MPSKKNPPPNGFFYFMQSMRPDLQREGVVVENNRELADLAGPRWATLSREEREPYNQLAKKEKQNRKYGPQQANGKMDNTRQYISQRVDTEKLNEQKRRKERKHVVDGWLGKDVTQERFLMIGFMSLCDMPDDKFMPCEMAIAEYSLRSGIIRSFHKYIDPGTIPLGYRYEAMKQSEATHQIPPEGFSTETYQDIYDQVLQFVNPRSLHTFPPVFCKAAETKLTDFSLDWLASRAGKANKLKKVYELEGLVCDLYAESTDAESKIIPSQHQAMELVSTTVFDYESGSRCKWHEEKEIRFCASGTVKRYCYCLSDFLCGAFGIEQTSNHLPERPDGESCTVITPRVANTKQNSARSQTRKEEDLDYRGYRNNNTYESGARKKQYVRRGPTYDEESLRSTDVVPSAASTPSTVPSGLAAFGRGRGRGRGVPTQPLRRPNLPGKATAREEEQRKLEISPSPSQGVLESPWSSTLGAGRGRGVRPPNTTPKGWAGHASAPAPSTAPLPPSGWQQPHHAWPSLTTTNPNTNLQNDFKSFSLFDKDDYDY